MNVMLHLIQKQAGYPSQIALEDYAVIHLRFRKIAKDTSTPRLRAPPEHGRAITVNPVQGT